MRNSKFVVLLAGAVIAIAALIYLLNFKNQNISSDTGSWGAFSDYLSPFVSIANLIIFIWLSIEVFNYNQKKDVQNENFEKAIAKPVLILKSYINPAINKETWIVKNIGNGAALNLKVAESPDRAPNWLTPTKCYSLGKGDQLDLIWFKKAHIICVTYQDIFQNTYVSIAAGDETFTQPLNSEYSPIVIINKEFTKEDFEKFLKLPAQRLHAALSPTNTTTQETTSTTTSTQTTNPEG